MDENTIILCNDGTVADYVSELAMNSGEDEIGLVLTAIAFADEKVSGGRVEEERAWGKGTFQTFDEPIFIGSAIAQLAGHVEVVILDSLHDWAHRLLLRFPDSPTELEAEVSSLTSVMKARMSSLLLVCRKPETVTDPGVREVLEMILRETQPQAQIIIDASGEQPKALKGTLPS